MMFGRYFLIVPALAAIALVAFTPGAPASELCKKAKGKTQQVRCECASENGGRIREGKGGGPIIGLPAQRLQPAYAACMQKRGVS